MKVRQTSIDAYHKIKEEGLLSKRRFEVYEWLFNNGPATAREVYLALSNRRLVNPSTYLGRLSELRNVGVLYELDEKKIDPDTGMTVIVWDVTSRLPIKLEKPKRIKCKHCDGKGYVSEQQTKMF